LKTFKVNQFNNGLIKPIGNTLMKFTLMKKNIFKMVFALTLSVMVLSSCGVLHHGQHGDQGHGEQGHSDHHENH